MSRTQVNNECDLRSCSDTFDEFATINNFASSLIDKVFNETVETFLNKSETFEEQNFSSLYTPKFKSSISIIVNSSDSPESFQNNSRTFRRHSTDMGSVYVEMSENNCDLNTITENNDSHFLTNRRHSLHSMDYVRKLNDLSKQYKKQNKNKLDTKRIVVNKSNSSSIGVGLNISSANASNRSSNESLNRKTSVNQYAKLTMKSILQKTDGKKKTEKKNLSEDRIQNCLKNSNYVNKLVSDIFDESLDEIKSKYRYS